MPTKAFRMKYKGYQGQAVYDSEAKIFHGDVIGLDAVITFQGKTVKELETAFKDSIDDYLEWCAERGENPELGKTITQQPPALHAQHKSPRPK